jgi:hypothetical protein
VAAKIEETDKTKPVILILWAYSMWILKVQKHIVGCASKKNLIRKQKLRTFIIWFIWIFSCNKIDNSRQAEKLVLDHSAWLVSLLKRHVLDALSIRNNFFVGYFSQAEKENNCPVTFNIESINIYGTILIEDHARICLTPAKYFIPLIRTNGCFKKKFNTYYKFQSNTK